MKSEDFFIPLFEAGAWPKIRMTPQKQHMSDSGKALIRYLCTEKPWRKLDPDDMWLVPAQYADAVDVVSSMSINTTESIGTYEVGSGSQHIFGSYGWTYDEETDEKVTYLTLYHEPCEDTFTDAFLEMLDYFNDDDWDALVSREPAPDMVPYDPYDPDTEDEDDDP